MAQVELIMPKMGESIMEATILKWLKNEGDTIEEEESVLEIATDKVDSEVPSPVAGVLVKKLYQEGDTVAVDKAIALIETESASDADMSTPSLAENNGSIQTASNQGVSQANVAVQTATATQQNGAGSGRFYSPLVLNMARKEGIKMVELETIAGTGKNGRVTKKDMLAYIKTGRSSAGVAVVEPPKIETKPTPQPQVVQQSTPPTVNVPPPPKVEYGSNVEIVEMDRMRRLISNHMVMSKHTSPHVTSFVEADVTNLVNWRNRIKGDFQKREGEKITFTPIFVEIVAKALKEFPMVNASVDGYNIILRKDINIGMATATPSGHLIVPVIKNADHKNLLGLAKSVNDLAVRARTNKLKPTEIQGGTFTLTNVGTFGSLMGTPIINQPQVAILATGAIRKKPAVLETEFGDVIAIRHMMILSLSYDHRIVDGALGSTFLKSIANALEGWDVNRSV